MGEWLKIFNQIFIIITLVHWRFTACILLLVVLMLITGLCQTPWLRSVTSFRQKKFCLKIASLRELSLSTSSLFFIEYPC